MIKDSEYIMPFGKHKGQQLCHVPADYLVWFMEQSWAKGSWPDLYEYCFKNKKVLKEEAQSKYYEDDDNTEGAPIGCDGWGRWARGEE